MQYTGILCCIWAKQNAFAELHNLVPNVRCLWIAQNKKNDTRKNKTTKNFLLKVFSFLSLANWFIVLLSDFFGSLKFVWFQWLDGFLIQNRTDFWGLWFYMSLYFGSLFSPGSPGSLGSPGTRHGTMSISKPQLLRPALTWKFGFPEPGLIMLSWIRPKPETVFTKNISTFFSLRVREY